MYRIKKTFEVSAAHKLKLDYESKCNSIHGHNYIITVHVQSMELDKNMMVMDFTLIKRLIQDVLDHKYLNEIISGNPTAENIAHWICMQIKGCYQVDVQESEGNIATYIDDSVEV